MSCHDFLFLSVTKPEYKCCVTPNEGYAGIITVILITFKRDTVLPELPHCLTHIVYRHAKQLTHYFI